MDKQTLTDGQKSTRGRTDTERREQVVEIAAANPTFPIILQWTGGRGGGHHSFEDFHTPILRTYAKIRAQSNIALVAGSGFGDADDSWPYAIPNTCPAHA